MQSVCDIIISPQCIQSLRTYTHTGGKTARFPCVSAVLRFSCVLFITLRESLLSRIVIHNTKSSESLVFPRFFAVLDCEKRDCRRISCK